MIPYMGLIVRVSLLHERLEGALFNTGVFILPEAIAGARCIALDGLDGVQML